MKPTKLYTSINEFKQHLESIEKPMQTKIVINNLFKGVFGTEWREGYEELVDNITKNNDEPIDESDFEMFIDNRNSEVIVTSQDFDKTLISHSFELNGNIYNFETPPE